MMFLRFELQAGFGDRLPPSGKQAMFAFYKVAEGFPIVKIRSLSGEGIAFTPGSLIFAPITLAVGVETRLS